MTKMCKIAGVIFWKYYITEKKKCRPASLWPKVVRELVARGKADLRLRDAAGCTVLQLLPSEDVRQELRALQPL